MKRILVKICNSTRSAFVIEDTIQLLTRCIQFFDKHFIYYVIDSCIKVLEKKDLKNGIMKKQEGKEATILRRWCLMKQIDPRMNNRFDMRSWLFNQSIPIKELFMISVKEEYKLFELYFICDNENEYMNPFSFIDSDNLEHHRLMSFYLQINRLFSQGPTIWISLQLLSAIVN